MDYIYFDNTACDLSGRIDLDHHASRRDLVPLEDNLCNGYHVILSDNFVAVEAILEFVGHRWMAHPLWHLSTHVDMD